MSHREELLITVQNQSAEELDRFLTQLNKKNNEIVKEILQTYSRQQTDELWEGLQLMCSTMLISFENLHIEDESDEIQQVNQLIKLLNHVVALATVTLHEGPDNLPIAMIDTTLLLHGIMLTLPGSAHSIKNSLVLMFEFWWNKQIKGKEEIITNTFDFILTECLKPNTPMTMIKRLWKLHDYLLIVDITMETRLRGKLLQCFASYNFYKSTQGVMFLSFLFCLDDNFILQLHTALKQEIPYAPKSLLEKFGEVYFRAWQKASDTSKQIIEDKCLQNLMHQAAVSPRNGDPNISVTLSRVLKYIHNQKEQLGVDVMLHDLYTPFLWRYLRAPNSDVRANCATILMDVFPLTTDSNEESSDELMQKQYEFVVGLLRDPNHTVRLIAVKGICNILKSYWELLPLTALNGILVVLVQDLTADSSCDSIRQAVIQGMTSLIDNRLTHTALQTILPQLKLCIHDTSEKLRIAVMDLLIKIKHIRTFKYWTIVPLNHILSHLTITESTPVKRRIMKLMFYSFFPLDRDEDYQIDRFVKLLETNADAARHFIKSFPQYMTVAETGKYMIMVCRSILTLIKQSGETDEDDDEDKEKADRLTQKEKNEDDEGLTIKDLPIMHGFLECILILWVVTTDLFDPVNLELLKDLQRKFRVAVPMMLKAFQDVQSIDLIIQIAGYLPAHYVPAISLKCISKLKQMTSTCENKDYEIFLEASCKWQKVDDVFQLISDWLTAELHGQTGGGTDNSNTDEESSSAIKRSKCKGKKRVGFVEPDLPDPQPKLGLDYLDYLTNNHTCQMLITNKYRTSLQNLVKTLQLSQECGGKCVQGDQSSETKNSEIILQAFTLYLKCLVLLHDGDDLDCNSAKNISPILTWTEQNLIQNFRPTECTTTTISSTNFNNTTKLNTTKRKRALRDLSTFYLHPDSSNDNTVTTASKETNNQNSLTSVNSELAVDMTRILLQTSSDVILCGFGDVEFCKQVIDLCLQCLDTDEDMNLLKSILICFYQTTEFYWSVDLQDGNSTALHMSAIPACLSKLYKTVAFYAKRRPEKCGDVINQVKKYVIQIFSTIIKTVAKDESISRDLMATTVAAVIAELSEASNQFSLGEIRCDVKTLPTLTGWIIEIINVKILTRQLFIEEIVCCINSEAATDLHPIHGLLHLLATLYKNKFKSSKLEDYHKALDSQICRLDELKPDDVDSEVMNLIRSKQEHLKRLC